MNAAGWLANFPRRAELVLHSDQAAVARVPSANEFTRERYFALELEHCPICRCDYSSLLRGPVPTLAEAVALCSPDNQAALEPARAPQ